MSAEQPAAARIYLSPPHAGDEEMRLVQEAFESNWIAPQGPHLTAFEQEFARIVGAPAAVALNSGTAAIHLALLCAGVGAGDEVLVSDFTFVASANPVLYVGARPAFIDSERESWNMDPALLAEALENRKRKGRLPRAIVLVHIYGQCADVVTIRRLCESHGVVLIEDAAEAVGARHRDGSPGTFGLLGAYSFNGNKILTTAGGGMLVAQDPALIDRALRLATQARDPAAAETHTEVGFNYRLSNVLAGIGRGQLRGLEARIAARRCVFENYRAAFSDIPGVSFMPEAPWGTCTRWLTCILVDAPAAGADRRQIIEALARENIEARPLWKPLHRQPAFRGCEVHGGAVADHLFECGVCLPSGSNLSASDQDRIIDIVRRTLSR